MRSEADGELPAGTPVKFRESPWRDPAEVFTTCFSGAANSFWLDSSAYSYCGCASELADRLPEVLPSCEPDPRLPFPFQGGWVGAIEFAHSLTQARIRLMRVGTMFAFDHRAHRMFRLGEAHSERRPLGNVPPVTFSFLRARADYLDDIRECQRLIREGESYEICLTNKLRGVADVDALAYYLNLRETGPAPFAAYLQLGDVRVACSSPEQFLRVTRAGAVQSCPIKGTAPRDTDPARLAQDPKTQAEHLMIVDLLRNDLGRVCAAGTVHVPEFMKAETHGNVHQVVSTIRGQLRPHLTALDALRSAFPGGSMTGAPKRRTLEILSRLETEARGIYSGAIGYISDTGEAEWNIVIRTAVFEGREVSIGTGGAIVALSDPEQEWAEIVLKAERLVRAFGGSIAGVIV